MMGAKKLNRFAASIFASVMMGSFLGSAVAQVAPNTLPAPANKIYNEISVQDMALVLGEMGIATRVAPAEAEVSAALLAQVSGGGNFSVRFLGCNDEVNSTGCALIMVRTSLNNSGVSYPDLNQYNISTIVTRGVNLPQQNIIAFVAPAVVGGGAGKQMLQAHVALFLSDMNEFLKSQASSTSVSLETDGRDTNLLSADEYKALQIGQKPDQFSRQQATQASAVNSELFDALTLENAIANTNSVSFMTDEIESFID